MIIIKAFVVVWFVFATGYGASSGSEARTVVKLRVGYDEAKPFHFLEKGVVVGTDADILRKAAENIGCELSFEELPWARTLTYLEHGELDVAIGASFKTKRAEWAYYSAPYKSIDHWLYTRADKNSDVASIEDFFKRRLTLGVVTGWSYPTELRSVLDSPENSKFIIKVSSFGQLPKMLNADRVNGIVAIPEHLQSEVLKHTLSHPFAVRAKYREELHFMFSKQSVSSDVVANFNNALFQVVTSGYRQKTFLKYKQN